MNNELRKKILLGAVAGGLAVYGYFGELIHPLVVQSQMLTRELAVATAALGETGLELKKLRNAEDADRGNLPLDRLSERLNQTIPATSLVTCPAALAEITRNRSLADAKIRLSSVLPFATALPGLMTDVWSVSVAGGDPLRIGEAMADIENRFPMSRINDFKLTAGQTGGTVEAEISCQIVIQK